MLFNSFNFLFYLPIVFVLYWHVFQCNLRWQNLFVVFASYVFYGWWDWRFLLLIVFTSLCSYVSGLLIDRCYQNNEQKTAKWWAGLNIVVNLLVLGVFKYFNFFADSFQTIMAGIGMTIDAPTLHIILPVGISFYTFQALSYTIDVYRRQLPATHDIVAFFAFISFFPQLVAGPIERATNLLPQFQNHRSFDYTKAVDGLILNSLALSRPYMEDFFINWKDWKYIAKYNEFHHISAEQKIKDGVYYNPATISFWQKSQKPGYFSSVVLEDKAIAYLQEIKAVFDKHHTSYKIVISPLYNQIKLNRSVYDKLCEIFGGRNVYDFSGVNKWNVDYHNYYEPSHYRPKVSSEILSIIYSQQH